MTVAARRKLLLGLAAFAAMTLPAVAADQAAPQMASLTSAPQEIAMRYEAYWGGFHAGDVAIILNQDQDQYEARLEASSAGAARLVTNFSTIAETAGRILPGPNGNPDLAPQVYNLDSKSSRSNRERRIVFDPVTQIGELVHELVDPPQDADPNEPPPPSAAMRQDALDPLSVLLAMRSETARALAEGRDEFAISVFDGKRVMDIKIRIDGPDRHKISGIERDTLDLILSVDPRAGFKDRHKDFWRGKTVKAYLDPQSLLPLRLLADDFPVATVINLVQSCTGPAQITACALTTEQ